MKMNRIELIELINKIEPNINIELEEFGYIFKWIKFEKNSDGTFCWSAERSYKNDGSVGYVFPMLNVSMVKSFKTLKGAKRNFIKHYLAEDNTWFQLSSFKETIKEENEGK